MNGSWTVDDALRELVGGGLTPTELKSAMEKAKSGELSWHAFDELQHALFDGSRKEDVRQSPLAEFKDGKLRLTEVGFKKALGETA